MKVVKNFSIDTEILTDVSQFAKRSGLPLSQAHEKLIRYGLIYDKIMAEKERAEAKVH